MVSRSRAVFRLAAAAILFLAGWLRVFDPGSKPIHADESVQAWKVGELLESGVYRYDPTDHHGPTLYYLGAPVAWLAGERSLRELEISTLRLLPALAGIALVAVTLALGPLIGRPAALFAAAFTAVSPLQVYYGRHFIQEPILVLLTSVGVLAGWRWYATGRVGWAVAMSATLGLAIATKETWVLVLGAAFVGCAFASGLRFRGLAAFARGEHRPWLGPVLLAAVLAPVVVLFTGFFADPGALLDVVRGVTTGVERSAGGVHDKPWHAYLGPLLGQRALGRVWSEAAIAFFALGALPVALARTTEASRERRHAALFILGFATSLAAVHFVIPYKTIWLACGFWHAFAVLAGIGAAWGLDCARPRVFRLAMGTLALVALAQLGRQAWWAAGPMAARPANPYAYVQTSTDVLRLPGRLERIAAVHPAGRRLLIKVVVPEYWPIPWLLRGFPNVGYWFGPPEDLAADVLLVAPELFAALPEERKASLATEFFGLRDGVIVLLAVDAEVWNRAIHPPPPP